MLCTFPPIHKIDLFIFPCYVPMFCTLTTHGVGAGCNQTLPRLSGDILTCSHPVVGTFVLHCELKLKSYGPIGSDPQSRSTRGDFVIASTSPETPMRTFFPTTVANLGPRSLSAPSKQVWEGLRPKQIFRHLVYQCTLLYSSCRFP